MYSHNLDANVYIFGTCEVGLVCNSLLQIAPVESAPTEVSFFHVGGREVPSPEVLVGMHRLPAKLMVRFHILFKIVVPVAGSCRTNLT